MSCTYRNFRLVVDFKLKEKHIWNNLHRPQNKKFHSTVLKNRFQISKNIADNYERVGHSSRVER